MLKFKIDLAEALERVGFNMYKAKTSGLLSQETLKKIKNEDTSISLKSLNNLCVILDMDLEDLICFTMSDQERTEREKIIKPKNT